MKVCRLSSRQQGRPTGKWLGGRWEVGGGTTLRDRSNRGQGKLSGDFTELCNFSLLHPSHSTLSRSESTPGGDDRRHLCYHLGPGLEFYSFISPILIPALRPICGLFPLPVRFLPRPTCSQYPQYLIAYPCHLFPLISLCSDS